MRSSAGRNEAPSLEIRTNVRPRRRRSVDSRPDGSIVAALRRRDPHAIDDLVSSYGGLLRSWSRTEGAEWEDVVQDVLLSAWRAGVRLDEETDLPGWLKTVTQNALRNRRRTRARRPAVPAGLEIEGHAAADPINEHTERICVEQALDSLPPRERCVIELLYLSDLPLDEVAGRMHTSREATKSLAARARRRIRTELEPSSS